MKRVAKHKMNAEEMFSWYYQNIDIRNRTIYFGAHQPSEELIDEEKIYSVNDWSAQNIIKGLYVLEHINNDPINIIWFSYGGDWDAGMAIYDVMKLSKCKLTMTCYGRVRSMGTVILQAADTRIISKSCLFMIHYGTFGLPEMHSKDAEANAKYNEVISDTMEDIYLAKIRKKKKSYTKKKLKDLMTYDCYLSPKEAVDLGLADKVL